MTNKEKAGRTPAVDQSLPFCSFPRAAVWLPPRSTWQTGCRVASTLENVKGWVDLVMWLSDCSQSLPHSQKAPKTRATEYSSDFSQSGVCTVRESGLGFCRRG